MTTCTHCKRRYATGRNCEGKFCSNQCQRDADWVVRKERIATTRSFFAPGATSFPAQVVRRWLTEVRGNTCAVCGMAAEWRRKPLTLIIDHANGNCTDNDPDNLRLVCPNCDAQSATYRDRNRGSGRKARGVPHDTTVRGRNKV